MARTKKGTAIPKTTKSRPPTNGVWGGRGCRKLLYRGLPRGPTASACSATLAKVCEEAPCAVANSEKASEHLLYLLKVPPLHPEGMAKATLMLRVWGLPIALCFSAILPVRVLAQSLMPFSMIAFLLQLLFCLPFAS